MKVALVSKRGSDRALKAARTVHAWLVARGHEVLVDHETAAAAELPAGFPRDGFADPTVDFAVVLGGDGTQLEAGRMFGPHEVPVFGVNLGRLGFLTDTEPDGMLDGLEQVLSGDRAIEARSMLQGSVWRGEQQVAGPLVAFNDLVVNKGALAQVMRIETRVDGDFVSSYLADGIIVSTPTGSTAYGLAVGGPIIMPATDVTLVAPICPHLLTNRPLVVPGSAQVECRIAEARGEVYLTIDGQEGLPLQAGDLLRVERAPTRALLVRSGAKDFFAVLRSKLGWGTA